jgi:hypothetical protein
LTRVDVARGAAVVDEAVAEVGHAVHVVHVGHAVIAHGQIDAEIHPGIARRSVTVRSVPVGRSPGTSSQRERHRGPARSRLEKRHPRSEYTRARERGRRKRAHVSV